MRHVLIERDGGPVEGTLEGDEIVLGDGTRVAADGAAWLAPVAPGKIVATHLTYRSRAVEYAMARLPQAPSYFLKPPSSLSAHRAPVRRPRGCRFLNYEGEIAVVIGRRCLGATIDDALSYVRGYTVANDWGVHDFRHADRGSMLRVRGRTAFARWAPRSSRRRTSTLATSRSARTSTASSRRRATPAPTSCSPSPTRSPMSHG